MEADLDELEIEIIEETEDKIEDEILPIERKVLNELNKVNEIDKIHNNLWKLIKPKKKVQESWFKKEGK